MFLCMCLGITGDREGFQVVVMQSYGYYGNFDGGEENGESKGEGQPMGF